MYLNVIYICNFENEQTRQMAFIASLISPNFKLTNYTPMITRETNMRFQSLQTNQSKMTRHHFQWLWFTEINTIKSALWLVSAPICWQIIISSHVPCKLTLFSLTRWDPKINDSIWQTTNWSELKIQFEKIIILFQKSIFIVTSLSLRFKSPP